MLNLKLWAALAAVTWMTAARPASAGETIELRASAANRQTNWFVPAGRVAVVRDYFGPEDVEDQYQFWCVWDRSEAEGELLSGKVARGSVIVGPVKLQLMLSSTALQRGVKLVLATVELQSAASDDPALLSVLPRGTPGAVLVEASSDLKTWGVEISRPVDTAETNRFFRLRVAPAAR